jgi:Myb-like DNA-binding domain
MLSPCEDLIIRFRTYFPEDYKRLYPNATSTRERATAQTLAPEAADFAKAKRKERTPFTKQEDENLLIGFGKHGGKWSAIQKDESLGLAHRRSTDLRDRFRNAFPERYVGAGFKPPPAKKRRRAIEEPLADENSQVVQTFEFRTDVPTPMASAPIQLPETSVPPPVRREQIAAAIASHVPPGETFSHTRLAWTNPHNVTAQKEMEMAMKIRRALDISNASEMMGDADIPLDPGLSDVAYQPHGQSQDPEGLTGLLDAAVHHGAWKRE